MKERLLRFVRTAKAGEPIRGRQIYILPTRYGVLFAVLVVAVFIGAVNYGNNLAFLLAFLLAAVGQITMHQTWRNLRGLRLGATPMGRVTPASRRASPSSSRQRTGASGPRCRSTARRRARWSTAARREGHPVCWACQPSAAVARVSAG